MNVARNYVCIHSDIVTTKQVQLFFSSFVLNLQISTKLGKGASFPNLSMKINNENCNFSFCKIGFSDFLEGVSPKNFSGASSQIPIFRQNTYENENYGIHLFFIGTDV